MPVSTNASAEAHLFCAAGVAAAASCCACVCCVQRLLLMGRRHEALDVALAGQLWGPALVLAHGYGKWTRQHSRTYPLPPRRGIRCACVLLGIPAEHTSGSLFPVARLLL